MERAVRLARRFGFLLLIGAAVAGATTARSSPASTSGREHFDLRAKVTRIVDGDTIDVLVTATAKRERIRLIGIDSPERGDCYSSAATAAARRFASGKSVRLLGDRTQTKRDRYERLLAYVVLPAGKDLGRELIVGGFALVHVYDKPFARLTSYRAAQRSAKSHGRGLWLSCAGANTTVLLQIPYGAGKRGAKRINDGR